MYVTIIVGMVFCPTKPKGVLMIRKLFSILFGSSIVRASRTNIRGGAGSQDEGTGFGTAFTNNWNET